jgi:hypothetical protein
MSAISTPQGTETDADSVRILFRVVGCGERLDLSLILDQNVTVAYRRTACRGELSG